MKRKLSTRGAYARVAFLAVLLCLSFVRVGADNTAQPIPFFQNWSNVNLITAANDWSGVAGIVGYRGDDLTTATGTDPQTILVDGGATRSTSSPTPLPPAQLAACWRWTRSLIRRSRFRDRAQPMLRSF
jgi:hypothetical protein